MAMRIKSGLVAMALVGMTLGCGAETKNERTGGDGDAGGATPPVAGGQPGGGGGGGSVIPVTPGDPWIVRGRWEIPVSYGASPMALEGRASSTQPMTTTVAPNVTYTVDNAGFVAPTDPSGVASFGKLDVKALRDNALRVCGTNGNTRCTTAALRLYTRGTPGAGLWNTVEAYGLPITSGTANVGLDQGGAAVLATLTLGNRRVVRLRDFTTTSTFPVPVAADFDDAAAGSYATTLVLEYVLQ